MDISYIVMVEIFDLNMTFLDLRMICYALLMTLDDHSIHAIRIKKEFGIESYAYHGHLAMFQFLTSKWPFLTPSMTSDDLEMQTIEFRRKFPIDPYAYGHIYMVRSIVSINGIKVAIFERRASRDARPGTAIGCVELQEQPRNYCQQ